MIRKRKVQITDRWKTIEAASLQGIILNVGIFLSFIRRSSAIAQVPFVRVYLQEMVIAKLRQTTAFKLFQLSMLLFYLWSYYLFMDTLDPQIRY